MSHRRRLLNLVLRNKHGVFSLHHIDLHSPKNSLFYDPTPASLVRKYYLPELKEMERIRPGTRPRLRLQPAVSGNNGSYSYLGRHLDCVALSDTKAVFLDYQSSGAVLYDDRERCLATLPSLMQSMWYPICLSTANAAGEEEDDTFVFVIERSMRPPGDAPEDRFQFQALVRHRRGTNNRWHCKELPPPPYISVAGYRQREIKSYGVVHGGVVCVSSDKFGTYCFDAASRAWSKAGDWALPFHGEVHHVPELGLLVGVGVPRWDGDHQIRACPVPWTSPASTAVGDGRRAPTLCDGALRDLQAFREEWYLDLDSGWPELVSLGSGKFCVVRCFETVKETCSHCNHTELDKRFAVFTGVEVVRRGRCGKDDGDEPDEDENDDMVRVIKHKSKVYMLVNNDDDSTIRSVL